MNLFRCLNIKYFLKERNCKRMQGTRCIYFLSAYKYFIIPYEVSVTKKVWGPSLVAQWLRICLPMQGTQVRALVQEDPTCYGATKPVPHNY